MPTLQTELNNEFTGKTVTITPSADNKEWTIKVDDVEETVLAGKEVVKTGLTDDEKAALQTNGIAEITGDDISNDNLKDNSKIKAVLTGDIPLTTEMAYVTGTKDTGVVVSINDSEFVWVPVPDAISLDASTISTSGVNLATNPSTERPMAKLQSGSDTNYEGLLYEFNGTTSTYKPNYNVTTTTYREPDVVTSYDGSSNDTAEITLNGADGLQAQYNAMIVSVSKYGGFYVGRYELGLEGTNPVSKPASETVTTAVGNNNNTKIWYGLYSKCKSYSKDNLTSTMIWGSQYDAMMNWMAKTGKTIGKEDYGKLNKTQETGRSNFDIINNVYDLYGCHFEWTLEAYGSNRRVFRGGKNNENYSPSRRSHDIPIRSNDTYSSRLSLYIK